MENMENTTQKDTLKELAELIGELYKYKPPKDLLLALSKKFPKGSINDIADIIDFLEFLSKNIMIKNKFLEEYENYDIALTFFIYLVIPKNLFFTLSLSNENLKKILEVLEDRIEFLKTFLENPEVKKQLEKAEEEVKQEIEEKKE